MLERSVIAGAMKAIERKPAMRITLTMKRLPKRSPAASEIIGALTEFRAALKAGEAIEQSFTVRTMKLELHRRDCDADEVKKTRELLKLSQALFAGFLGIDVKTLRSWEQGRKKPAPIACRFMDEIANDPEHWRERVRQMLVVRTDSAVS